MYFENGNVAKGYCEGLGGFFSPSSCHSMLLDFRHSFNKLRMRLFKDRNSLAAILSRVFFMPSGILILTATFISADNKDFSGELQFFSCIINNMIV